MTFLAKVLIGTVGFVSLDRPFTYLTEDDSIKGRYAGPWCLSAALSPTIGFCPWRIPSP
jgi:hypothetical protein